MRTRMRAWRTFVRRDRDLVQSEMELGRDPQCPLCSTPLGVRPVSRLAALLPPQALAYDLECQPCRRYHVQVQLKSSALRLLRLNRLAAAVLRA